jgi:hypothetical protein
MEIFLAINVVLTIHGVSLTVILFPMTILLRHGEVPCDVVLISQQSSSFSNFPFAKSHMEPSITFQSFLSSY